MGKLEAVGQLDLMRSQSLSLVQPVDIKTIKVVADCRDKLFIIDPGNVRAPPDRRIIRLKTQS